MPRRSRAGSLGSLTLLSTLACANLVVLPDVSERAVGASGGDLRSLDGALALSVPPGALDDELTLSLTRVASPRATVGAAFRLLPEDLNFTAPVYLRYDLHGLSWSARLSLATWDGERIVPIPSAVDVEHAQLVARYRLEGGTTIVVVALTDAVDCAAAGCGAACALCDASDPACAPGPPNYCDLEARCSGTAPLGERDLSPERAVLSCDAPAGIELDVGRGTAWVLTSVAVAPERGGFALQDASRARQTGDNALSSLSAYDADLRTLIRGGPTVTIFELGLGVPHSDDHGNLSVRSYSGARNGGSPPLGADPARVVVSTRSLDRARPLHVGRARWERGHLLGSISAVPFEIPGAHRPIVLLEEARFELYYSRALSRFRGTLGGALLPHSLADAPNPYCEGLSAAGPSCGRSGETLLEVALGASEPDVDLDGDGLERIELDGQGRVWRCIDGDGAEVAPILDGEPASCVQSWRMADGFSLALEVELAPAEITGVVP